MFYVALNFFLGTVWIRTSVWKFVVRNAFVVISSSWNAFDQEKQTIKNLLMKNLYPSYLIDKEIFIQSKNFLEEKFPTKKNTNIDHNNKSVSYYKLPYIGSYSNNIKKKNLWVI